MVLPVMIAFLLVIVQMGFLFNFWIDTTHLASTGARYASVNNVPGGMTLEAYLADKLDLPVQVAGNSFTPAEALSVCVEFPGDGAQVGEPITVRVSDTYQFGSVLQGLGMDGMTVTSSATQRLEAVPDPAMLPATCPA